MSTSNPANKPSTGLPTSKPEEVGFSSERLARVGPAMQKYIDKRIVPGIVTLVAHHGRVIHFEHQGLMDIDAGKSMTDDTIFRIMSMTKPIVSVGLMTLYEEGHFLLDQPISRYLPSFKKMIVKTKRGLTEPANREITFRDVLTHTAGFDSLENQKIGSQFSLGAPPKPLVPGTTGQTVNQPGQKGTIEEAVELLAKAPLGYQPGTEWEYYADLGVLGVLIEKISGQSLDRFLQERILDPLKMVDTYFYLPKEKASRLAACYREDQNQWGMFGLVDSPATSAKVLGPKTYLSPGGGLLSTAADYSRFAQMLLNGGILDGIRILGRKTIELMTINHTGDLKIYPSGPGYGHGLGFSVRLSLVSAPLVGTVGTYGWQGAFCTIYFADPKEDLFGLVFTQVGSGPLQLTLRRDFERMVYQALVGE